MNMNKKHLDLGKTVKFSGEYGIIILDENGEEVVRWDTPRKFDNEEYNPLVFEYEFISNYEFKFINKDGTLKK